MKLTATNVENVLFDCFYLNPPEKMVDAILVHGVRAKYGFDPKRVEIQRQNIESLLSELHPNFKVGYSFLAACETKDGDQWGEQKDVDTLICLGLAIGKVSFMFPREIWSTLPGGMPYLLINPT